jgi:hypothetical protein
MTFLLAENLSCRKIYLFKTSDDLIYFNQKNTLIVENIMEQFLVDFDEQI